MLTVGCSIEVLCSLSCLLNTTLNTTDDSEVKYDLRKTERRLRFCRQEIPWEALDGRVSPPQIAHIYDVAELYRLSGIIYYHRVCCEATATDQALLEAEADAFRILGGMRYCEKPFPLLIVGCQARTDMQRAMVLRVVRDTIRICFSESVMRVRKCLERFWAQEDLDTGKEIGYAVKMAALLRSADGWAIFA
jgi:hypothetical protein